MKHLVGFLWFAMAAHSMDQNVNVDELIKRAEKLLNEDGEGALDLAPRTHILLVIAKRRIDLQRPRMPKMDQLAELAKMLLKGEQESKIDEGVELLKKAAELGSVNAMNALGRHFAADDSSREPDLENAKYWFKQSAEKNCHDGLFELGYLLINEGDTEEAIKHYKKLTDLGSKIGPYALAVHYTKIDDLENAERYCLIARQRGHCNAGDLLEEIKSTIQN